MGRIGFSGWPTPRTPIGVAIGLLGVLCASAQAYIDVTPSLGRIIKDSGQIVVLQVEKVNREKQAVVYRKVTDLKGKCPADQVTHVLTDGRTLTWAEEGKTAVAFMAPGGPCVVCTGGGWYECHAQQDSWWRLSLERPELLLAYAGSVLKLRGHVEAMVAGKEAVITTAVHGAGDQAMTFEIAFNQLQGSSSRPLQRIRASLGMPDQVYLIGTQPRYFVGLGSVGAEDLPQVIRALQSPDPLTRIGAADDLLSLADTVANDGMRQAAGPAPATRREDAKAIARRASPALAQALGDADALVRLHVAAALARFEPTQPKAAAALREGLRDRDARVRKTAAEGLGRAGIAARPAVPALLVSVQDTDASVRRAAIEALGAIGSDAGDAVPALMKALGDPAARCPAAEALGRIGARARPSMAALAEALSDPDERVRWAAARSMALIGGPEAKGVLPFLIQALENARGRDLYNITLYLGILGPVAKEAMPALQRARARDHELVDMALWAIQPENRFPWELGYTNDRDCDLWLFVAYIRHMGDRAKPAAAALADRLVKDAAGHVPSWGYRLLAEQPDAAVPVLTKALAEGTPKARARVAAALGRMGPAARGAVKALEAAAKDPDPVVRHAAARSLDQIR
jgi:HEAT repeat protein